VAAAMNVGLQPTQPMFLKETKGCLTVPRWA